MTTHDVAVFLLLLYVGYPLSLAQNCESNPCANDAVCEETSAGYQCFCVDGFAGDNCDINFDDCSSFPCWTNAIYVDDVASYTRRSISGFAGDNCDINFDDCSSLPCRNNATCVDGVASYSCICIHGFTGQACQTDINECLSGPCLRNGECIDIVNGYVCQCEPPYKGVNCELLPCETVPCENEGLCSNDLSFNESISGYICDCLIGFTGIRCEVNIEDCDLENDTSCNGNGLCVDGINDFSCLCEPGWVGQRCGSPIDDCIDYQINSCRLQGNQCRNNATCGDRHLGYLCNCTEGYEGSFCERERDECSSWSPCGNGATCVDLFNDYTCKCSSGWIGKNCTEEVNECSTNPCENGAQCVDIIDGFLCRCRPFYTGQVCETLYNPCDPEYNQCQNGANCVTPPDGKYICFCKQGFTGVNCEINSNECLAQPCINNGTCEDGTASYICHCGQGWSGKDCGINDDDCASQPCMNGATCFDLLNRFDCNCSVEYTGRLCTEMVDFCLQDPCFNDGTCVRVLGGYICQCAPPYTGEHCLNLIDECHSDPCQNNGTCMNTKQGFLCNCQSEYTGKTCNELINYCASQPCLNGGVCRRLVDGYVCVCPPYLTGKQCTDLIDYCKDEPCQNSAVCINDEFNFRCVCLYGFKGDTCSEMEDICSKHPCQNLATCSNIPGGFVCACPYGFIGDLCQNLLPSSLVTSTVYSISPTTAVVSFSHISSIPASDLIGHLSSSQYTVLSSSTAISSINSQRAPSFDVSSSIPTTLSILKKSEYEHASLSSSKIKSFSSYSTLMFSYTYWISSSEKDKTVQTTFSLLSVSNVSPFMTSAIASTTGKTHMYTSAVITESTISYKLSTLDSLTPSQLFSPKSDSTGTLTSLSRSSEFISDTSKPIIITHTPSGQTSEITYLLSSVSVTFVSYVSVSLSFSQTSVIQSSLSSLSFDTLTELASMSSDKLSMQPTPILTTDVVSVVTSPFSDRLTDMSLSFSVLSMTSSPKRMNITISKTDIRTSGLFSQADIRTLSTIPIVSSSTEVISSYSHHSSVSTKPTSTNVSDLLLSLSETEAFSSQYLMTGSSSSSLIVPISETSALSMFGTSSSLSLYISLSVESSNLHSVSGIDSMATASHGASILPSVRPTESDSSDIISPIFSFDSSSISLKTLHIQTSVLVSSSTSVSSGIMITSKTVSSSLASSHSNLNSFGDSAKSTFTLVHTTEPLFSSVVSSLTSSLVTSYKVAETFSMLTKSGDILASSTSESLFSTLMSNSPIDHVSSFNMSETSSTSTENVKSELKTQFITAVKSENTVVSVMLSTPLSSISVTSISIPIDVSETLLTSFHVPVTTLQSAETSLKPNTEFSMASPSYVSSILTLPSDSKFMAGTVASKSDISQFLSKTYTLSTITLLVSSSILNSSGLIVSSDFVTESLTRNTPYISKEEKLSKTVFTTKGVSLSTYVLDFSTSFFSPITSVDSIIATRRLSNSSASNFLFESTLPSMSTKSSSNSRDMSALFPSFTASKTSLYSLDSFSKMLSDISVSSILSSDKILSLSITSVKTTIATSRTSESHIPTFLSESTLHQSMSTKMLYESWDMSTLLPSFTASKTSMYTLDSFSEMQSGIPVSRSSDKIVSSSQRDTSSHETVTISPNPVIHSSSDNSFGSPSGVFSTRISSKMFATSDTSVSNILVSLSTHMNSHTPPLESSFVTESASEHAHLSSISTHEQTSFTSVENIFTSPTTVPTTKTSMAVSKSSDVYSFTTAMVSAVPSSLSASLIAASLTTIPTTTTSATTTTTTTAPSISCGAFVCFNGGTCREDTSGIYCDCGEKFIGLLCETGVAACQGFTCENGGYCTVTITTFGEHVPRCNCLLPYSGTRCDIETLVYYPSFIGSSFMKFAPPTITSGQSNEIYISVKTNQNDGTILYSASQNAVNKAAAFIRLFLRNGMLSYSFSCDGIMMGAIKTDHAINTGDVFEITIRQVWAEGRGHWCSAALLVNTKSYVSSPVLTIDQSQTLGDLFIGGVPRYSYLDGSVNTTHIIDGFIGCVRNLQINAKEIDLVSMATTAVNIENCNIPVCQHNPCRNGATCHSSGEEWYCSCPYGYGGTLCERKLCANSPCYHGGTCIILEAEHDQLCLCPYGRGGVLCEEELSINVPSFSGTQYGYSSYLAYTHLNYMEDNFEIQFKMVLDQNSTQSNLIMFMGNSGSKNGRSDFLAVGLYRSFLVFKYDLGSGYAEIYSPKPVNLSMPHHVVKLGRDGLSGWLEVDNQRRVTGRSFGILTALNTNSPFYVGGYDVDRIGALPNGAVFSDGFTGCIYDVFFRNFATEFVRPGSPPSYVEEGRNVKSCDSMSCDYDPCYNGAQCVDLGASLFCNCTDGWKGVFCLDAVTVCDLDHSCADGSTCLPTIPDGYKCLCPLGKRGEFCNDVITISDPLFVGEESYMSFRPVYIKKDTHLQLQIKPNKSDGLVFYVAQHLHSNAGDFLCVTLFARKVELRYDLGTGVNILKNKETLSLDPDIWYTIKAGRNSTHGYIDVNGQLTVSMTTGMMSYLDTTTEFYLGGLPNLGDVSPLAFDKDPTAFEGCIRELIVNGKSFELTEYGAMGGRNVLDCDNSSCGFSVCKNDGVCTSTQSTFNCTCSNVYYGDTCEHPIQCLGNPCVHGKCRAFGDNGYLCDCYIGWVGTICDTETMLGTSVYLSSYSYIYYRDRMYEKSNKSNTNVTFVFKTSSLHGLLLWNGQTYTDDEDYLGIGIKGGRVKLVWNLGWYTRNEFTTPLRYDDDIWHSVNIQRSGKHLSLSIDDVTYESTVSGDFTDLDTRGDHYIGAFKDSDVEESTLGHFSDAFKGCIQDMMLHGAETVVFDTVMDGLNVVPCNSG